MSPNFIEVEENFDHSAVVLTLSEKIIKNAARSALGLKTTDWETFKKDLQNSFNLNINPNTTEQLEIETENFTGVVQRVAYNNTKEIIQKEINNALEIRELVEKRKELEEGSKWKTHLTSLEQQNTEAQIRNKSLKKNQ